MRSRISIRGCVRRSVGRSDCPSVCRSVRPSVPNELKSRKWAISSKVRVKDGIENECMTNQATVKSAGTIISASTITNTSEIPAEVPARQRTHLWSKHCSTLGQSEAGGYLFFKTLLIHVAFKTCTITVYTL